MQFLPVSKNAWQNFLKANRWHVVWTPLAEFELEEILFYIRIIDGRPETARRIGQELRDYVERIANQGIIEQKHRDAPADWSYVTFKRWLIFYRKHERQIEVMRVVDGARDLPSTLGD